MIEFLNSLEWPAVFAIVGSIVTIVTGLFGYLLAARKKVQVEAPQTKILTPEEYYERVGDVPNVTFTCGVVEIDEKFFVYYGAADKVIGVANIDRRKLLQAL